MKAKQKEGEYKFTLLDAGADVTGVAREPRLQGARGRRGGAQAATARCDRSWPRSTPSASSWSAAIARSCRRFASATSQPFDTLPEPLGPAQRAQAAGAHRLRDRSRGTLRGQELHDDFPAHQHPARLQRQGAHGRVLQRALRHHSGQAPADASCRSTRWPRGRLRSAVRDRAADDPRAAQLGRRRVRAVGAGSRAPPQAARADQGRREGVQGVDQGAQAEREARARTSCSRKSAPRWSSGRRCSRATSTSSRACTTATTARRCPRIRKLGPAAGASGGIAQPKGKDGEASTEIKTGDANKLQIRYNNFHPWVPVIQCPTARSLPLGQGRARLPRPAQDVDRRRPDAQEPHADQAGRGREDAHPGSGLGRGDGAEARCRRGRPGTAAKTRPRAAAAAVVGCRAPAGLVAARWVASWLGFWAGLAASAAEAAPAPALDCQVGASSSV